jgi:hypothetical protein
MIRCFIILIGQWKDGNRNGEGEIRFANGNIYKGIL